VRTYADNNNFAVVGMTTKVEIDRSRPDEKVFRYEVQFEGNLTPEQEQKLSPAANAYTVKRLVSKLIRFESRVGVSRSF
jgi:hypothetical protein